MPSVNYRRLGSSGLKVSPLCLGAMNFGNDEFGCDESTSLEIIGSYLDAGHNFIDTANVYSGTLSETIVGKAVKGRRDEVVIATKAGAALGPGPFDGGTSRKHLMKAVDDSLRRLNTDYIDLYQMHRYDDSTPLEETLGTLNDLVRQGKVRYIGVSNWFASQIAEAARIIEARRWEPLVSLQPQYSIISRDIEVEIVPVCEKFGLGLIPWSPLAAGMLTGKYKRGEEPESGSRFAAPGPFQQIWRSVVLRDRNFDIVERLQKFAAERDKSLLDIAIGWLASQDVVSSVIAGATKPEQVEQNAAAADLHLSPEELAEIDTITSRKGNA